MFREEREGLFHRERPRKEIALGVWALEGNVPLDLQVRFDAFGDYAHAKFLGQIDDARDDRGIVVEFPDTTDEGPIDLERIETVSMQVAE
jgi:hypothetical protein